MASQRREVIPKCSTHTNQELLFCENCDSVFCAACKTSPHSTSQSGSHNVIPFAVAIKRMSEILLYKANECLSKVSFRSVCKFLPIRCRINNDFCFFSLMRLLIAYPMKSEDLAMRKTLPVMLPSKRLRKPFVSYRNVNNSIFQRSRKLQERKGINSTNSWSWLRRKKLKWEILVRVLSIKSK